MASLLNLMNQSSSRFNLKSRDPSLRFEIESFQGAINRSDEYCPENIIGDQNTARNGVYITWEYLWVTVSNKSRNGTKPILQGLTGYARPGELLAIMGPSGCGKTTLLDALAGRLSMDTRKTGDILVNGQNQALAYGTSAYVTQDEALVSTLTVRETVHYSAQLQLPAIMSKAEKRERADATIREMGLQDAMDTVIGSSWGPVGKSLSSGQKRRVNICLEMLTHPKLLFLDEPTSGLDSAASYYVMKRIAWLNHQKDGISRTIVASIHQPSSEVFQLFDTLCLLSYGKAVYFGPTSRANEGGEGIGRLKMEDKARKAGFVTQCSVLTRRSFVNMYRDVGYYWFRLTIQLASAFSMGTIYHNLGYSYESIQARGSMIVFLSAFSSYMAVGSFPSFGEDLKVFIRERLNGHYGAGVFITANTISSIPYLLLLTVIPGAITYYLTGMNRCSGCFLYFQLLTFACMIIVEGLMMVIASIVPNFLVDIIIGTGVLGIMILAAGMFRLPGFLPKLFWKYPMYYISMHRYLYQGMSKNEFEGLEFEFQIDGVQRDLSGKQILSEYFQIDDSYSKWFDLWLLVGMAVFFRLLFFAVIKYNEIVRPKMVSLRATTPRQATQVTESP